MEKDVTETAPVEDAGSAMEKLMAPVVETPPAETPPPAKDETTEAVPPTPPADEKLADVESHQKGDVQAPPLAEEKLPDVDKFDEEIDAIAEGVGSPKSKEAVRILKDKLKAEHGAVKTTSKQLAEERAAKETIQARITELEAKQLTPEIEGELTELRSFKQTYAIESDPSVTKPFEDRKAVPQGAIKDVLNRLGVTEKTQKFFEENGGLHNFRVSDALMPAIPEAKNPDGSVMTHAQFYKKYIADNSKISELHKENLNDAFSEIRRIDREKDAAVRHLVNNKSEYVAKKQAEQKAAAEDWAKRVGDHSSKVLETYGDDAKLREIPPNASPEILSEIEKHNATYKTAEARALQILSNVTPESLTEAAIAAAYVPVLQEKIKANAAVIEALKKERDEANAKLGELVESGKTSDLRGTQEGRVAPPAPAKNAGDAMAQAIANLGK